MCALYAAVNPIIVNTVYPYYIMVAKRFNEYIKYTTSIFTPMHTYTCLTLTHKTKNTTFARSRTPSAKTIVNSVNHCTNPTQYIILIH